MVKCVDCKIIAHLECKDLIPAMCTLNQYQIDALNVGNLLLSIYFFVTCIFKIIYINSVVSLH